MIRGFWALLVALLVLSAVSGCGQKDYVPDPSDPPPDFGDPNNIESAPTKKSPVNQGLRGNPGNQQK